MPSAPVLLIEDTQTLALLYEEYLRRDGHDVILAHTGHQARTYLDEHKPKAIILDLLLPDTHGLTLLDLARTKYPDIPVIVVTVTNSLEVAVDAMRKGAYDYIVKPLNASRLSFTLRNALNHTHLASVVEELKHITGLQRFHGFVGQSDPMQAVYHTIEQITASKAPVFLVGERGTGKELAAQAIHASGPRREKPFIHINCSAIPHELMESILFGHVRGAFPGAVVDQQGAARAAHGGTLFLDELCEMPLELQTKLLRFVHTGEVISVGSSKLDYVDVRLVCATNRDPVIEMRERRFREDLFYRLHVVRIDLPPLRERGDDLLMLTHHFLTRFSAEENKHFNRLAPDVERFFRRYEWPGNVRQLENVIHNVVVLHEGTEVTEAMLPKNFEAFSEPSLVYKKSDGHIAPLPSTEVGSIKPLWQVEKETILSAIDLANQDITRAALMLEVSPSTLYRKLNMWRHEEALSDE